MVATNRSLATSLGSLRLANVLVDVNTRHDDKDDSNLQELCVNDDEGQTEWPKAMEEKGREVENRLDEFCRLSLSFRAINRLSNVQNTRLKDILPSSTRISLRCTKIPSHHRHQYWPSFLQRREKRFGAR